MNDNQSIKAGYVAYMAANQAYSDGWDYALTKLSFGSSLPKATQEPNAEPFIALLRSDEPMPAHIRKQLADMLEGNGRTILQPVENPRYLKDILARITGDLLARQVTAAVDSGAGKEEAKRLVATARNMELRTLERAIQQHDRFAIWRGHWRAVKELAESGRCPDEQSAKAELATRLGVTLASLQRAMTLNSPPKTSDKNQP